MTLSRNRCKASKKGPVKKKGVGAAPAANAQGETVRRASGGRHSRHRRARGNGNVRKIQDAA
jgi:hypothetical protein